MTTSNVNLAAKAAFLDGKPKRLLIDGQWVESASGKTFATRNPATSEQLAAIAEGDAEDVDRAVAVARRAFEGPWSKVTPAERQRLLIKLADVIEQNVGDLALLDSLDLGAAITVLTHGYGRLPGLIRFYAAAAVTIHGQTIENSLAEETVSYTVKEPVGVVAGIVPFNAPAWTGFMKILPVLATGCTMVVKPPSEAPVSLLRIGELLLEAGVPAGVVNIVTGPGRSVGMALAAHCDVDKVTFTGSSDTGQEIVRASAGNIKRVSLELGGKSPNIIFADADLQAAIPGAAMAVFLNAGQMCVAGSRLFIERPVYEAVVGGLLQAAQYMKVGNQLDPETVIGPVVSEQQLKRVTGYMDIGKEQGARLVTGGQRLTDGEFSKGYFVPPTVFADVRDDMRIAKEEIFGPVISAIPFDDISEVINRANATTFGLASAVWTRDVAKAHRVARSLRAGTVWVNCYLAMDAAVPYGGYKMSGYGRESGVQHLDDFLNTKAVWIKL